MGMIRLVLFFLLVSSATFGVEGVDWAQLKDQLNNSKKSVAKAIAKNWSKRPHGFFRGVNEGAWDTLIPLLSTQQIGMIRNEEFKMSREACRVFSKYLLRIPQVEDLPTIFRSIFYEELDKDVNHKMFRLVGKIPAKWIQKDGPKIVKSLISLDSTKLCILNESAMTALFQNPKNACSLIDAGSLMHMAPDSNSLQKMTPECMAVLKGLGGTDLSQVLWALPTNAFAKYNGPLFVTTITGLSKAQLQAYGALIKDGSPICQSLKLNFLLHSTIDGVTARCLWGYLSQGPEMVLGDRWQRIPMEVLLQFTPFMQSSWASIHSGEFGHIPSALRKIILSSHYACSNFSETVLTSETIQDISALCFYTILSRAREPIILGSRWKNLPVGIIDTFSEEMMEIFGKIDGDDFYYMPSHVLQVIVDSEVALASLQKVPNKIRISPAANSLILTEESFARIARLVPRLAGELLLQVGGIPDEIYASCDGDVLRSLGYERAHGEIISWDGLFKTLSSLKGETENFGQSIKLMSTKTAKHLCSTIETFEEYLLLTWLRLNLSNACRLALKFDLNDPSLLIRAPELIGKMIPWKEMLNTYEKSQWREISSSGYANLFVELGKDCEFWKSASQKHSDFLKVVARANLKYISPHCVLSLKKKLVENCDIISDLNNDAFALYQAGELPCGLRLLSDGQLKSLSTFNVVDLNSPTILERSLHVLSHMTAQDLESLSDQQVEILMISQSRFVPDVIKTRLLSQQFDSAKAQVNQLLGQFERQQSGSIFYAPPFGINLIQALENLFLIYFVSEPYGLSSVNDAFNFDFILQKVNGLSRRNSFVDTLFSSDMPWNSAFALVFSRDFQELRDHLRRAQSPGSYGSLDVVYSPESGFDRASSLQSLYDHPQVFANSATRLYNRGFTDVGGPMRIFVSQLLSDIQRDLVVFAGIESNTGHNDGVKFFWGTSQEIGLIVGLVFGKALQMDMRLPFALDPAFYELISNSSDKAIESYYKKTYSQDFADFRKYIYQLQEFSTPEDNQLLDLLTRPDSIRFTTLSSAFNLESAKSDFKSKTNIRGCGDGEGFEDEQGEKLRSSKFLQEYLATIDEKFLSEFKAFVRQVVKGLGHVMPAFEEFVKIPAPLMRPIAKFLPILLNAKPLQAEDVIQHITFNNNQLVQSLFYGRQIMASEVVSAFIRSLDEAKLAHFIGIVTGAPTLSLDSMNLTIDFYSSYMIQPIDFDFCTDAGPEAANNMAIVAPGEQYLALFDKFARNLPSEYSSTLPDCYFGGVGIAIGKPSTCSRSLSVYLQPAQSLFNSLVYQLNESASNVRD